MGHITGLGARTGFKVRHQQMRTDARRCQKSSHVIACHRLLQIVIRRHLTSADPTNRQQQSPRATGRRQLSQTIAGISKWSLGITSGRQVSSIGCQVSPIGPRGHRPACNPRSLLGDERSDTVWAARNFSSNLRDAPLELSDRTSGGRRRCHRAVRRPYFVRASDVTA